MDFLKYSTTAQGYINRYWLVGPFTKDSPYEKKTLTGKVNEWLEKGPGIYDHPSRKDSVKTRMEETPDYIEFEKSLFEDVTVFQKTLKPHIYFPFEKACVDLADFYRTPTFLRSYAFTYIEAPEREKAEAVVSVCGSAAVWLNGRLIKDFTPFKRNEMPECRMTFELEKGLNALEICFDDLAERDTDYNFSVRYLGKQDIKICIPVPDGTNVANIYAIESLLKTGRFERDLYLSSRVKLVFDAVVPVDIPFMLFSDHMKGGKPLLFKKGENKLDICDSDEMSSGFTYFALGTRIDNIEIVCNFATFIANSRFDRINHDIAGDDRHNDIQFRKEFIKELIRNEDPGNEYKVALDFYEGRVPDNAEDVLKTHLAWVNEKRDCSDFRMVYLLGLYYKRADIFPESLREKVKAALLSYRYWIDEPGDDVMWFFSENHALMFHFGAYFAGKALPDEVFASSGLKGSELSRRGYERLNEWFDTFNAESATEWNSSTYLPIDVMGIAYVYYLTDESDVLHSKAKEALDLIAFELAIYEQKGHIVSTFGRTYEKELKGSLGTGMPSILYLWFNAGHMNSHYRALVPLILSDYEPPVEYLKYTNISGDTELIHQNIQGINKFIRLYMYKNRGVQLSSAITSKYFTTGHQENILQATIDDVANVFINCPGEEAVYGRRRPSYWCGNGNLPYIAQHENLALAIFNIPEQNEIDYTHAYIPLREFDNVAVSRTSVAVEKNGAYIGVRALNGLEKVMTGPTESREFRSKGRRNIWILKVGKPSEYNSVDALLADMDAMDASAAFDESDPSVKPTFTVEVKTKDDFYRVNANGLFVNNTEVNSFPLDVRGKITLRKGEKQ